ncbi:MAG: dihydrofolate reductase [Beijerinckiaceae bacterium]
MTISLVAAVAQNGVIGRDNQLLWRIKSDLQHFRALTLGKPVIMGRKTYESIGRPLPGRDNIVITRDGSFAREGIFAVTSLDAAFEKARALGKLRETDSIMVAGGGEIYRQTIGMADKLFITEVDLNIEGDATFPAIDRALWQEVRRESHAKGPDDDARYAFVDYIRR